MIILAVLGFLIPFNLLLSFQPNAFITFSLGSAYFWGTLALWAGLGVDGELARCRPTQGLQRSGTDEENLFSK
jgi:hypothetical protein